MSVLITSEIREPKGSPQPGDVCTASTDETFVNPRRGASYDRLDRMTIFGADAASGERRIELELRGIDFPKRDIHVHAIAVNPQWAAKR